MILSDVWRLFEQELFPIATSDGLFNPYQGSDPRFDRPGAVEIRRENLRRYLACFDRRPPVLVLAEAPGPWGCRFSGVPLTSEAQLCDAASPVRGRQSSLNPTPYPEYSASIYWRVLGPRFPRFFTWNAVPLHPHRPGDPLSIRTPTSREIARFSELLASLLALLAPEFVLAVGRKAEGALAGLGRAPRYVRHPSQGGARLFEAEMRRFWEEGDGATS